MITLQVDQLDNHQRNAYGTTKWATDYAGRNPVEGVNGMIKDDGTFNPASCRVFGTAAHTLAAIVIHNLDHTRRVRRAKNRDNNTAYRSEQATPDTTPTRRTNPANSARQNTRRRRCGMFATSPDLRRYDHSHGDFHKRFDVRPLPPVDGR